MAEVLRDACPFPGLPPYTSAQAHLFFGRDRQVEDLLQRLDASRFIAVTGASGSGKSSLVLAGLLPALAAGMLSTQGSKWRRLTVRPGADPLQSMVDTIDGAAQGQAERPPRALIDALVRGSPQGLTQALHESHVGDEDNILLVVDQFEELFRLGREQQDPARWARERNLFVQALIEAAHQKGVPIFVVITMRTDFIGHCTRFRGLPELLNESQYLVPRLGRREIEQTVVGPMKTLGYEVAPRLVRTVVTDAVRLQVDLPVMQHALMQTWHKWQEDSCAERMDLTHYDAAGRMDGSLDEHAEEVFEKLPPGPRRAAKILFSRVTTLGHGTRSTRAPTSYRQLLALVDARGENRASLDAALAAYRHADCRFLDPPPQVDLEAEPDTMVDVTHEAVLRGWSRLGEWMSEERNDGEYYRRLLGAAQLHQREEGQLLRERQLVLSLSWWRDANPTVAWARRYHDPDDSIALLDPQDPVVLTWHGEKLHEVRRYLDWSRDAARRNRIFGFLLKFVAIGVPILGMLTWKFYDSAQTEAALKRKAEASLDSEVAARIDAFNQRQAAEEAKDKAERAKRDLEAAVESKEQALELARAERQQAKDAEAEAKAAQQEAEAARDEANTLLERVGESEKDLAKKNISLEKANRDLQRKRRELRQAKDKETRDKKACLSDKNDLKLELAKCEAKRSPAKSP